MIIDKLPVGPSAVLHLCLSFLCGIGVDMMPERFSAGRKNMPIGDLPAPAA